MRQRRVTATTRLRQSHHILAADALMPPAHVDRVAETVFIVRAGIEQDGEAMFRGDAGPKPCIAPFCLSEYPCPRRPDRPIRGCVPIADDNASHLVIPGIGEHLRDTMFVG